jgi:hypothetical protein
LDFGARTEWGSTVRDFRVWRVQSVLDESIFGLCFGISGKQIFQDQGWLREFPGKIKWPFKFKAVIPIGKILIDYVGTAAKCSGRDTSILTHDAWQ